MSSVTLQAILKRALPFFAAFAVALFITSFFVDLNRPRFFRGRGGRHQEMQRLRSENERLTDENQQLREQLEDRQWMPREYKHPGREDCPLKNDVILTPRPVAPKAVK